MEIVKKKIHPFYLDSETDTLKGRGYKLKPCENKNLFEGRKPELKCHCKGCLLESIS